MEVVRQQARNLFENRDVSVAGIGISNLPLIDFLLDAGARVNAYDKATREKFGETANELEQKGVRLHLGEDSFPGIGGEYIFRSPGIRPDLAEFEKAVANGSKLTSEIELFLNLCPAHTIGITGSNGKTTTTTLIYKFLQESGKKVFVGGNIGQPLLPRLYEMDANSIAVLELSSFQLMGLKRPVNTAVVTNISPNHLDYHKDMDEYVSSKKSIFTGRQNRTLILNIDDEYCRAFAKEARSNVVYFSTHGYADFCEKDGYIVKNGDHILKTDSILLRGRYNVENYMAAIAASYRWADKRAISNVAETFAGVEHRLEFVREKDHVKYFNSSIDSSPSRTEATLTAFNERLVVICGGYDKNIPYDSLIKPLCEKARVLILTGDTSSKIKKAVFYSPHYSPERLKMIEVDDFGQAVRTAVYEAKAGETVLLSPASASFDKFKNFEERGNLFKEIVNSL